MTGLRIGPANLSCNAAAKNHPEVEGASCSSLQGKPSNSLRRASGQAVLRVPRPVRLPLIGLTGPGNQVRAGGPLITGRVNGTLNLTQACRYRHFEPDPSASSAMSRSREQCGQMFSSLSFALLGRAMMPARRLSLSR